MALDAASLDDREREIVGAHYVEMGLAEHASIAAFARFSMQLLALGAPADLVEAATRAMGDETRHARAAFGIAAAVTSRRLGPSQLPIEGSLAGGETLEDIVRSVVREGVIGETLAALELRYAAEVAAPRELRKALARIADDETRHAELAFAFIRWALESGPNGAPLERSASVAQVVTEELAACRVEDAGVGRPSLAAWGVLDPDVVTRCRIEGIEEVVAPLVARLLSTPAHDQAPRAAS